MLTAARSGRPASRHAATCATTSSSTRAVSSRITGVGSATRMSSSGTTMPRSGCRQRSSASTPTTSPVAIAICGW